MIFTIENITALVKPLAQKYQVKEVYLFGSYARLEADHDSDIDLIVIGGDAFKATDVSLPFPHNKSELHYNEEIGKYFGSSAASIAVSLSRTRKKLRKHLEKEGYFNDRQ